MLILKSIIYYFESTTAQALFNDSLKIISKDSIMFEDISNLALKWVLLIRWKSVHIMILLSGKSYILYLLPDS